jgi:hypothetical protein
LLVSHAIERAGIYCGDSGFFGVPGFERFALVEIEVRILAAWTSRPERLGVHQVVFQHLPDRQPVRLRERQIALVVRRNAHNRAVSVAHQHIIGDPDFHFFAGERMSDEEAGRHPLLFHRGEVGFHDAAALAFGDERGELRSLRRVRSNGCSAATAQNVTPMIVSARVVNTYIRPSSMSRRRCRVCRA